MKPEEMTFIILAGGKSRRLGKNKADIRLGNQRLIELLAGKGRSLGFAGIFLSGYAGCVEGCRTIADGVPDRGPLGGLSACLSAMETSHAFVIPVDCPGISSETIGSMLAAHREAERDVTLLREGTRVQPLIGIFPGWFGAIARDVVRESPAPVFRALDRVAWGVYVPKPGEPAVLNLNTKEAWQAFARDYENHWKKWQSAALD